jgi:SAM-dependent methyltransferase
MMHDPMPASMDALIDHDNLEEFADAVLYDGLSGDDEGVAFYTSLARETGGPVLEIACGTGRAGIPIAQAGFAVTGIDIAPSMVELARRKSAGLSARWVVADARSFELGEQFRLIFITGNAWQGFLTLADQAALLGRVQAHLAEGGIFAFETRNPLWRHADGSAHDFGDRFFIDLETRRAERPYPPYTDSRGRTVRVSRTHVYDHVTQLLHWTTYHRWEEDGHEQMKVTRIALRYTFPQELVTLLHYNGFVVARQYGDWDLQPLSADSPSIITVCRRAN